MPGPFLLLRGFAAPPFLGPGVVACTALALSRALDVHADLTQFCASAPTTLSVSRIAANLQALRAFTPPMTLMLAWFSMLVAMMMPLVALPLAHVRASSLVTRRWRASAAFLLGYFGIWGLAGPPLLVAAMALRLAAGGALATCMLACLLALIWSASPIHQAAQNRAHRLRRIGLFGLAADRDCLVFGAALGSWCLVSCWAWMLVPLLVPDGHLATMVAVAAIVMAERLRGAGPLRWRAPVIVAWIFAFWHGLVFPDRAGGGNGHV